MLAPLRAPVEAITAITVCTRPFRACGPRLELESIGGRTIVHNYGHGGSGWSLSWGSSAVAARMALATGERDVAVIGCGALGLTSALLLQRAGARVTILARELPPLAASSLATGIWSPDSRICLQAQATAEFQTAWEGMVRHSWNAYQALLGQPGDAVERIDLLQIGDGGQPYDHATNPRDGRAPFAQLEAARTADLLAPSTCHRPGTHSLGERTITRTQTLMFNITQYMQQLMAEFTGNGGRVQVAHFRSPADFAPLAQKTLVNATGYGARQLFDDQSIVPVRGQLARMAPQPEVRYGILYRDVGFIPRRDALVFQKFGADDYFGYGDESTAPDRAEAAHAVSTIGGLFG